jgi:hypothetical protein
MGAAFARTLDSKRVFAPEEAQALERELPTYWFFLLDRGRLDRAPTPATARNARIDKLRREIEGPQARASDTTLDELATEKLPPRPLPLSAAQKEYCRKFLAYRTQLYNVQDLGDYKRVLDERTKGDLGNPNEQAMRDRVDSRFEAMKKDAANLWRDLDPELKRLRAQSSWFRSGYCLETKSRLQKRLSK